MYSTSETVVSVQIQHVSHDVYAPFESQNTVEPRLSEFLWTLRILPVFR